MKKLTAGIFTVLIGLCAANSADAAVASKGYADAVAEAAQAAAIEAAAADATTKADAAQAAAEKTASDALDAYKTTQAGVDSTQNTNISDLTDFVGALPEGAAATTIVGYITEKTSGIATDAALGELQSTVSTNTTNIGKNTAAIATINGDASTPGSFAKAIADSINALSAENGAIKAVVDDLAAHELLAEQTYATKADVNAELAKKADNATTLDGYGITDAYTKTEVDTELAKKQDKLTAGDHVTIVAGENGVTTIDAKISNVAVADAAAQEVTAPSIVYAQAMINASLQDTSAEIGQLKQKVGDKAVSEQISTAVNALANDAVAANTSEINTLKGIVNDAEKGVLKNAEKAAQNATDISNEVSRATEAEEELQTAIDTKLTAKTTVNSGIVTTDAEGNIIPVAPAACENMLNYCVLTYGRASATAEPGYIWEVVARDGEGK